MVLPCQNTSFFGWLSCVGCVWRLPSGGFVAAWASFCGLLNMVICAVEIHFHLLGWWVVCVVFGVHCKREIWVIFVIQEFDWWDNFSASSRQHWVYIAKLAIYQRSKRVKQAASKNLPFYSCVVKRVFVGLALVGWNCPQVGNWLHSLLFAM